MKKIAVILALITILSMLALPISAVETGKNLGELPQTTEKITIDGKKDTIYDQGMKVDCTLPNNAAKTSDVKVAAYLLWDGKKTFYAFVDVTDKTTSTAWSEEEYKAKPWVIDSIELFFDFNNDGKDRDQYRIDFNGKPTYYDTKTYWDGLDKFGFDAWGYQKTANGYAVEFKVTDFRNQVKAGGHVGIDWQVNDRVGKDASADRIVYHFKSSLEAKNAVGKLDYITLGSKVVTVPVATTTKAAATTAAKAATTTAAAKTADASVIVAAVAVVALAGVVVCKKKH